MGSAVSVLILDSNLLILFPGVPTAGRSGGQAFRCKSSLCHYRPGLPALWAFHYNP